ncbi:MAG: hypothetical protein F2667_10545 [Actinobacteria bacterium]|uniref:Unannotated protein n=1 Tax=freshwater metagenome TaxID=449393 RepID=A0A6J6RIR5_9ZZZZ|nr:hypothetical protein [Actinomycetota bacterium]
MRTSSTLATLSLAPLTLGAALALATIAPALAEEPASTTTHEVGNVLECTGTWQGRAVYASLYENAAFTNVVQVLVGDDGDQVGDSRESATPYIEDSQVKAGLRVGGKKATVKGYAVAAGPRRAVHDVQDDAGQRVESDGFHRRLDHRIRFTWKGVSAPLTCATAFHFDLQVTRTDVTGD